MTTGDKIGSLMTVICLALAFLSPIIFAVLIFRNTNMINDKKYQTKLGSLTDRLRLSAISFLPLYSNVVDMLRTLITVVVVVYMINNPG